MIIVKIFQGPGNQLFQYAYGVAVASRLGVELKLDISWFNENSFHRSFILDRFGVKTPIATEQDIAWVKSCNGENFFQYRFNLLRNWLAPRAKKTVVKEDVSVFDRAILYPHTSSYIEGYFSTEEFFKDSERKIRSCLEFTSEKSYRYRELAYGIDETTVAFSIRRGDFLNNPLHNVCSIEYYYRAIDRIIETVESPKLLVFSDDFDWVQRNFKFAIPHMIASDLDDHMDHMRLMSLCSYHVIPNSTFSWWGAWLSNPKIVVAPDLWLNSDKDVHLQQLGCWAETSHTVPADWIRIPSCLRGEKLMH